MRRYASGSRPCRRAEAISVSRFPAAWAWSSLRTNSQFFRPIASPRSFCPWRSRRRSLPLASAVRQGDPNHLSRAPTLRGCSRLRGGRSSAHDITSVDARRRSMRCDEDGRSVRGDLRAHRVARRRPSRPCGSRCRSRHYRALSPKLGFGTACYTEGPWRPTAAQISRMRCAYV